MAIELAIGYVSIVPETKGFANKLNSEISGPMESAGRSGGSSFASGFSDSFRRVEMIAVGAFTAISAAAGGYIVNATLTAARTETLGVAMDAVGKATGTSSTLLAEQEAILKKQGITTQESRGILTLFMQSELDVADASKVARVAQDLAVISGENSSDAARTLTEAIVSQQPELLKQYGIVKSLPQIYDAYGKSVGKSGSDLTETEKKQAMLNTILEAGAKVTGVYETAMTKAGKMLTSFPRYFEEIANAVGNQFLPAFADALKVSGDFLKQIPDFFAGIEKKTAGKPLSIKVAMIFDELEITFGKWWEKNKEAAVKTGKDIGKGLVDGIANVIVGIGDVISQAISPKEETSFESVGKGIGSAFMSGIGKGLQDFANANPLEFIVSSAILGGQTGGMYGVIIGAAIGIGVAAGLNTGFQKGLEGLTWNEYLRLYWAQLTSDFQLYVIDGWTNILNLWSVNFTTWLNGWGKIMSDGIVGIANDTIASVQAWMSSWNTTMTSGMVGIASDATYGLSSGLINGAGAICSAAVAVISQALSVMINAIKAAWIVGVEFVQNLAGGVYADIPSAYNAAITASSQIISGLGNAIGSAWDVGVGFVQNLAAGIWSAIYSYLLAPLRFIQSLLHNPSPVMGNWAMDAGFESGGKFMAGLNEALQGNVSMGSVRAGLNINPYQVSQSPAYAPQPAMAGGQPVAINLVVDGKVLASVVDRHMGGFGAGV